MEQIGMKITNNDNDYTALGMALITKHSVENRPVNAVHHNFQVLINNILGTWLKLEADYLAAVELKVHAFVAVSLEDRLTFPLVPSSP